MEKPLNAAKSFKTENLIFCWLLLLAVAFPTYYETQLVWREISLNLMGLLAVINLACLYPGSRQKISTMALFLTASSFALCIIVSMYVNPAPPYWFWIWNLAPILIGSLAYGIGGGLLFLMLGAGNEAIVALSLSASLNAWLALPWFNHCLIYLLFVLSINFPSLKLENKLSLAQQRLDQKDQECRRWEALNKELKRKDKENLQFQEQLTDEIRSRELLISLTQYFDPGWDTGTILEKLIEKLKQTPGAHAGGIYLAKAGHQDMELAAASPLYRGELLAQTSNLDIPALVGKTGKPITIIEAEADPRLAKIIPDFKIKSALYYPLTIHDAPACLCLWSPEKNYYSEKDYKLIEDIITQAQSALKHGRNAEDAIKTLNPLYVQLNTALQLTEDIKNPALKQSLQGSLSAIHTSLQKII
jgi:hypothetical protein